MKATIYHPSQHLTESEVYPVSDYCPLCNRKSDRSKSVDIQHNPDICLITCTSCKGSFASYMPLPNILDKYYENYYSDDLPAVTFHDSIKFAKHILEPMDFSKRKEISILDFGGGGGDISYAVAQELMNKFSGVRVNVTVVDYKVVGSKVDGNLTLNSKRELDDVSGESYDLVIASAVLEHIPGMYKIIIRLFSMINQDGYFYARTPYMEPLMRLSNKIDMTYPAHIYDLGGNYWNGVVQTYDLNAVVLCSRPSIVETSFRQSFFRALIAYTLKIPGFLESKFFHNKKRIYWKWVGGWEIYLKFPAGYIQK